MLVTMLPVKTKPPNYSKMLSAKEQWTEKGKAVREPLGKINSRKLKSATYKTSLPGAPDGQYIVIQYDSSFEHKKSTVETVTPMLDQDGQWRVSGRLAWAWHAMPIAALRFWRWATTVPLSYAEPTFNRRPLPLCPTPLTKVGLGHKARHHAVADRSRQVTLG